VSAERTPKTFKALQLIGFLMIFVGVIARAGAGEYWGSFLALTGFVVWALGKALAWWRTG
jgi:hypothetical protein